MEPKFSIGDSVQAPCIGISGKIEGVDTDTAPNKVYYTVRINGKSTAWLSEQNIIKE